MTDRELIVNLTGALIWPIIVLTGLALFKEPLVGFFSRTENINILGVQISANSGDAVNELRAKESELQGKIDSISKNVRVLISDKLNLEMQKDSLQELLADCSVASADEPQIPKDQITAPRPAPITSYQRQSALKVLSSQIDNVQQITHSKGYSSAQSHEDDAIEFLLQGELEKAEKSFIKAESSVPGFHNAYEIANLIKDHLSSNADIKSLYSKILSKYSWGMRPEHIQALKAKLN